MYLLNTNLEKDSCTNNPDTYYCQGRLATFLDTEAICVHSGQCLCFVVLHERMMLPGVVRTECVQVHIMGQLFLRCGGSIDSSTGFMVL